MKKSDMFINKIKKIKRYTEDLSIYTSKELYSYSFLINSLMRKIFANNFLGLIMLFSVFSYAQNDSISIELNTRFFSLTPKVKKVNKVNGLAFGTGIESFIDNSSIQKVNGINLELNPVSILTFMFVNPRGFSEKESVVINGLHFSTGNLSEGKINGIAISFFNINHSLNGFSASATNTFVANQTGFHVSGLSNSSQKSKGVIVSMANHCEDMKGFQLGIYNGSDVLKGVQLGIFNNAKNESKGLQIGLINQSKKHKGLQVGFWNINQKRSFPFINW